MAETYPSDSELLALTQDAATGVEYIPTGKTPYFLEFRRMLQRLLLAAGRSNELRVYSDGALTVGVRGGRAVIGGAAVAHAGSTTLALTNNAVNNLYLNSAGNVVVTTSAFPADRSTHIRLASVTTSAGVIAGITDLRGEAGAFAPFQADPIQVALSVEGNLTATQSGKLMGLAPCSARVVDVILTLGTNIDTDNAGDGITATVKKNGTAVCTTNPKITDAAGTGFRSTAQGQGTAAVVKSDGTEIVAAGDQFTVDLTRTVAGTVTTQAANVTAAVVLRAVR